jgi:hypothetical protein
MRPQRRPGEGDGPLEQGRAMSTGLSAALELDRLITDKARVESRAAIARSTALVAACRQGMPRFGDPPLPPEDKVGRRSR